MSAPRLGGRARGRQLHRREAKTVGCFAPPAAGDRGQVLGCALYAWHGPTGDLPGRALSSDCFGRDRTDEEIRQALNRDPRSGLAERRRTPYTWRRESDIARTAAQIIADGKIIGWFQGGSELGPRALGARSVLAGLRTPVGADALKHGIKHREPFRPFAPAAFSDHAATWFDLDAPSPFSLPASPVRSGHAHRCRRAGPDAELVLMYRAAGAARVRG
ncbi:carbamoyltransferase C-terminal domain-containing protein [Streptomyces sp. NBC_00328]|uniref:carbamoyltransferase C-terminal domain-containing protein n=1 Tax=Streptomyces sp. NBC_00328 TaxID=2903646 RepID=UPI003FA69508